MPATDVIDACAVALGNDRLFLVGSSINNHQGQTNNWIYDFGAKVWGEGRRLMERRHSSGCAGMTWPNGTSVVVIAGGKNGGLSEKSRVQVNNG